MRLGKILCIFFAILLMSISVSAQNAISNFEQIAEFEVGIVRDMITLADGTYVVASDSGFWTINPLELELQHWETPAAVSRMFFLNGYQVLLAYEDMSMGIWDNTNGVGHALYSGQTGAINAVIPLNSNGQFISAGEDGSVRLWNSSTAEDTLILEAESAITQLAYNPYTGLIAVLTEDDSIHLWSYAEQLDLGVLSLDEDLSSIGFNPRSTSSELLVGTTDGKIRVWPIVTQAGFEYEGVVYPLYEVPLESGSQNLALVNPGRSESSFVDPNNPSAGLIIWTGNWRSLTPVIPSIQQSSESLVLDAHSAAVEALPAHFRLIISIGEDRIVRGWLEDYTEFYQLDLSADAAIILMNKSSHEFFASVHEDNSVSLWSAEFGTEYAQLPAQTAKTTHIAGSIATQLNLALATEDGILHLWRGTE